MPTNPPRGNPPISSAKALEMMTKSSANRPSRPFIMARLENVRSFARGDFFLMNDNAYVTDVPIEGIGLSDRGYQPRLGEIYYITGYPTDDQGNMLSDDADGKPNFLDRNSYGMKAAKLITEEEEVDEIEKIPARPLGTALRELAADIIKPLKGGKPVRKCERAPINLKEALARSKGINNKVSRTISPVSETIQDPTTGKRVVSGAYIEQKPGGGIAITANGKGIVVNPDGTVEMKGKVAVDQFGMERPGMAGMPSSKNMLTDVQPNTIIMPAGLGPLALDRLPDFSILNWALKLINGFKSVMSVIDKVKDLDGKSKPAFNSRFVTEARQEYSKENLLKDKIQ